MPWLQEERKYNHITVVCQDRATVLTDHWHVCVIHFIHSLRNVCVPACNVAGAAVVGLQFGESPSGQTRLFSLGRDCRILEYSLENLSHGGGLKHVSIQDVVLPGGGQPTAMCFAPPMPYYSNNSMDTLLLLTGMGCWAAHHYIAPIDQRAAYCAHVLYLLD